MSGTVIGIRDPGRNIEDTVYAFMGLRVCKCCGGNGLVMNATIRHVTVELSPGEGEGEVWGL